MSCINVVNVEDSPITRVIQELNLDEEESSAPRMLPRTDSGNLEALAMAM